MAMGRILTDAQIAAGLATCKEPGSFNLKTFCDKSGMRGLSKDRMREFFALMDQDKDGFIGKDEVQGFLRLFASSARLLTDRETRAFLSRIDTNEDGKIDFEEFVRVVSA